MLFGPVNPIDNPYGQFVCNYTHPRKPLCSVSYRHNARGSGQLNGRKDRCEVNHVSLREHVCTSFYVYPFNWQGTLCVPSSVVYSGDNVNVHEYGNKKSSMNPNCRFL
ncbi:hypothetical protein AVEN_75780-1 [Araneus ventricosus]|uniref:Uncharacterized protein n=1 Tax=Araneus ventricosus TaxID=182803 RepID=A0A4Y2L5V2_ARAVE|nr:hypothetical protein AVEN_75780-1 [Araneus ventricosus]